MSDSDRRDVFLEVAPQAADPPEGSSPRADASYLEPAEPADVTSESSPRRKKVRAGERAQAAGDEVSLAIVAALQSDGALMSALWPDVSAVDLLRTPPPDAAFAARVDYARRAIDAVARRDAESRARAEVAQRGLQRRLDALGGPGPTLHDAALAELRRTQVAGLMEALKVIAGGGMTIYAAEVARFLSTAEERGVEAEAARHLAREAGYTLHEAEARTWTSLDALPGSPRDMDAAALALLKHPAQGAEAVRSGAVLAWLRANGASTDLQQRARDARMVAERGGAESLTAHTQAWALGRKDLAVGTLTMRTPGEIAPAVRRGAVSLDDLARSAREGTLAAWLRMQGWVPAAGAADLVARGEALGLKRLAWSLGEPLVLGDQGVGDPATLARVAVARPDLRDALLTLYASGDLLAWLESLPPVLRDEPWASQLRRARSDTTKAADTLALWRGVYAHARAGALTVTDSAGSPVELTTVAQLRVTAQVAEVWDSLKRALRTGELLAWLSVVAPETELPSLPRPPRDEDGELNTLLWALGHTGLVMEWGTHDAPVTSLGDIVRAYQRGWQQFEAQASREYVFAWIERFHGSSAVLPAAPGIPAVKLRDALVWLRAEVGRLPAGHLALKLATLCGLRQLPVDPCAPGDEATVRGYTGVTGVAPGTRRAWEPLRTHATSGSAVLWLALAPGVRPQLARSMLQSAFLPTSAAARTGEHVEQVMGALAREFGDPVASMALEAELRATTSLSAGQAMRGGATGRAESAGRRVFRRVVLWMSLMVGAAGAYAWWAHQDALDPDEPAAPTASEQWVQLKVRVEADRARQGRQWDLDRSAPELRVTVRPRGETVLIGPCESGRTCEGTLNAVRLVADVPFRVSVDEMDFAYPDRVGATWLAWRGGRDETLRARVGAVEVTVAVRRLAFQPLQAQVAAPVVDASVADAGRARVVDAGTTTRRTTRTRARETPRVSIPQPLLR